jgi:hypothetical protein
MTKGAPFSKMFAEGGSPGPGNWEQAERALDALLAEEDEDSNSFIAKIIEEDSVDTPNFIRTYERTVVQRKQIVDLTVDNIAQVAQLLKATVDYTGEEPVLIIRDNSKSPWKVPPGFSLEIFGLDSGDLRVMNANGFNFKGDWSEVDN